MTLYYYKIDEILKYLLLIVLPLLRMYPLVPDI